MWNNFSNITDLTDCEKRAEGATIISPVLMFLTGVVGNILALCSLYKSRRVRRATKFYNFITGLVWTDLLGIVVTSPSVVLAYVNGRQWIGGDVHCRLHGFAMTCFGLATPLFICAMAVERFLALKCVFFYSNRCHFGTARAFIVTFWLFVIVYGLFPLFGFGNFSLQYPCTWCFLDFRSDNSLYKVYGYIYACTNLTLIGVIVLCNAYVVFIIVKTRSWREKDRHKSGVTKTGSQTLPEAEGLVASRQVKKKTGDVEIQTIVLLCALTIVFTCCWAPLMLHIVLTLSTGSKDKLWDLAAVRLASINQTLDPWLYILLRRSSCVKLGQYITCIYKLCFRRFGIENPSQANVHSDRNREAISPNHKPEVSNGNVKAGAYQSNIPRALSENLINIKTVPNKEKRYFCRVQFRPGETRDVEDAMYVKILYLPSSSSSLSIKTSKLNRFSSACSSDERPCLFKTLTSGDVNSVEANVFTKSVENGTEETSLTASRGVKNTLHSESQAEVINHQNNHEGLRKTKSNLK